MKPESAGFLRKAREFLLKAQDALEHWPDEAGRAAYLAAFHAAQASGAVRPDYQQGADGDSSQIQCSEGAVQDFDDAVAFGARDDQRRAEYNRIAVTPAA